MLEFPLPVWSRGNELHPIELGDPENIGFAVETAFLSGLQAEIQVLPFWRPPCWISHFRFGRRALPLVSLDSLTPKTGG